MQRTTAHRLAAALGLLFAASASRAGVACRLVLPADAAELLGAVPGPPVTNDGNPASANASDISQCGYRSTTTNAHLTVIVRQGSTAPALFARARAEAKLLLWADPQDVPGLGDRAYWTGVTFQQLNVLRGDTWLIVAADLGSGKSRLEEARRVATRALARWAGEVKRAPPVARGAPNQP